MNCSQPFSFEGGGGDEQVDTDHHFSELEALCNKLYDGYGLDLTVQCQPNRLIYTQVGTTLLDHKLVWKKNKIRIC